MTCTRRSIRTGRPCRRDHAAWPDDWPDLPPVVACWTHLTEDERAMCLQARERQNKIWAAKFQADQAQREREAEQRRAAGIPDPVPVQYEPRPCNNTCVSQQRATGSDSDSAISACANCDFYVCLSCGNKPAPHVFGECTDCDTAATSYLLDREEELAFTKTAPDLRGRLNQLVGQIVAAGGGEYARVHAQLNRDMGVQRRDQATAHDLQLGVEKALAWLEHLTEDESPSAPTPRPPRLPTQLASTDRPASLTDADVTELRRLIIDATAILERLHAFEQRLQPTERTPGRA